MAAEPIGAWRLKFLWRLRFGIWSFSRRICPICATLHISARPMNSEPFYRSVAVASTFSPRFIQVLAEAKRIRDRFDSALSLIYVGTQDAETTEKFAGALRQLDLPLDSQIHYETGEPASAILRAADAGKIDLIVAGALEKEVILRPFLGNVARRLVRDADCSVILFTHPETEPKQMKKIVFMADYSEHGQRALGATLHLAQREGCERLYAVRVYTTFDEARASRRAKAAEAQEPARTLAEEEAALEQFILAAGQTDVPIEARCVRGNTAYAASDFVQAIEADLLAVPVLPHTGAEKKLPAQIAWVMDVIPCNLWIIR
jgi:nucleotide-binding universal stress UspA family protein